MRKKNNRELGFTLIELAMVILLVGILAAVAIPTFIDFRTDAKNASIKGSLGALRSAVVIARTAIALREDAATPDYPTVLEMQGNAYDGSHPVLSATTIMDPASGIPQNPWSLGTLPATAMASVFDCSALAKSLVVSVANFVNMGWCYGGPTNGYIWANSAKNGGAAGATENTF